MQRKGRDVRFQYSKHPQKVNRVKKTILQCNDELTNAVDTLGEGELSHSAARILEMDLQRFALYLMASDGTIEDAEVDLFNFLFDMDLTAEAIKQLIIDCDIYTTEFEKMIPLSLHIYAYADSVLKKQGDDRDCLEDAEDIWEFVGKAFTMSDGDASQNEIDDFHTYMRMLKNAIPELRQYYR